YKTVEGIDWQDKLFRTSPIQNHTLSLSGGSTQTKYITSLSYAKQDGIITNSGYDRLQGRFAFDQQIDKDWSIKLNVGYTSDNTFGAIASSPASDSNAYLSYLMYRVWAYRPVLLNSMSIEEALDDTSS